LVCQVYLWPSQSDAAGALEQVTYITAVIYIQYFIVVWVPKEMSEKDAFESYFGFDVV